jgi:hypothetical protein
VEDLYKENCKILKKEIEDVKKWKYIPYSWISKINMNAPTIPKVIYRFIAIPLKFQCNFSQK